jgi:hypothetical protein
MQYLLAWWPIYAPAVALIGIGLGMIRLEEFRVARVLFWAAATLLSITDFAWQLVTDSPFWFRAFNGFVVSIAVFVIFPMLLRWLRQRETKAAISA